MRAIINHIQVNEKISTSGQPTKKQFKYIAQQGFDVVINLAMHNKGALKEEDKIVSKNGMVYIHIPITWKSPEIDRLELFLTLLRSLQEKDQKVFVHCIMNYRASVFIYHYKKSILGQKDASMLAPSGFKPNSVWKKMIAADVRI